MNMEVEQHLLQGCRKPSPVNAMIEEESDKLSPCFDCCICMDNAHDPVVTLCGHLYCWPCIYKWLQFQGSTDKTRCPVCKSEISETTVVPVYYKGEDVLEEAELKVDDKAADMSLEGNIPPRPTAVASWGSKAYENMQNFEYQNIPFEESSSHGGINNPIGVCDHPVVGMFGEMVYERVFGNPQNLYAYPNSYYSAGTGTGTGTGTGSLRLRRQEIEIYTSLNRLSFFLFCCLLLCLFLF